MSDISTAQKPSRAAAPVPAAAPAKPQTRLRDRPKTFPASSLKPLGYGETEIMTITLAADWRFDDMMNPAAWTNVVGPIAANALKTQVDRIGTLIYVNTVDSRFMAWLRIDEIIRDHLKNPCGMKASCVGPSIDMKTGRPAPLDLRTGLAWVDPEKPKEDEPKAA